MTAWSGKLPDSIRAPMTDEEQQAMTRQNLREQEQRRLQQANEKIASDAQSLVRKVEDAISAGGGTPQGSKHQYNYGIKGKYLDSVISAACGLWAAKGTDYTYRYNHYKPQWGDNQTNFEQNIGGWNHNVHVSHA